MTHASRKKQPPNKGEQANSLSGGDQPFDTILLSGVLGATHTSLDVASVSPFHPLAALSRLTVYRNIKDNEMELQTKTTGLGRTFQKKLTLMEALNTKWEQAYAKTITEF